MKKRLSTIIAIVAALGMLFIAGPVIAADNASQTVTMTVSAINEIAVSGSPALTFNADNIKTVTAGAVGTDYVVGTDDFQVTDATATYSVTTNSADAKKITASLDSDLAAVGLELYATLASTTGTSATEQDISDASTTPVDLVTALSNAGDIGEGITYRAVATVFTPVAAYTPEVTLTITAS